MEKAHYVMAYDIGTTGNKTCLYRISEKIALVESSLVEYPLYLKADGGAEQVPEDWWRAVCEGTRRVLSCSGVLPEEIMGLSFCCQMQGSVMVDKDGNALRNAMGYMDSRATRQKEQSIGRGLIKISDCNAFKLLNWLRITGGCPATAKDPVWKYLWVKEQEPQIFERTYKWLDVKDYLILRCSGEVCMTKDSAHVTFLYDTRPGRMRWHEGLCRSLGIDMDHLPEVVSATDRVGNLTAKAAAEMGLKEGTPVFGGGGDVSLISIGAGCLSLGDMHIYVGTSGWVSACVDKRMVDVQNFIASILGALPGCFNYTAEQETSGLCLKWVRDHLALDEIGMYLDARHVCQLSQEYRSLYEFLSMVVDQTEPGAGGAIFTPWFQGNRAPREDPYVRAMFFNIGLSTGKRMLIRAVLEGVAYHKRWLIEAVEKKAAHQDVLRFVGGGALSDAWCRIMADVTGRMIEVISEPQNAGALGAAVVAAVGLGLFSSFAEVKPLIPVQNTYVPRRQHREVYDRGFQVFKDLYQNNRQSFHRLNKPV